MFVIIMILGFVHLFITENKLKLIYIYKKNIALICVQKSEEYMSAENEIAGEAFDVCGEKWEINAV